MFCPRCNALVIPVKEQERALFRCSCGYTSTHVEKHLLKESMPAPEELRVAESGNSLAVHDRVCKKCGHAKAELIEKGVWYSDEDAVVLYKCGNCGHTEMEKAKVK